MPTTIFIRIEQPDFVQRPGVPIAQIMREVVPVIEMMIPLRSGNFRDRISGEVKAEWTVEGGPAQPLGETKPAEEEAV